MIYSPADLIRLADTRQLAALAERYRNSPHGMKLARLRTLRRAVAEQLQRNNKETSRHA